MARVSDATDDRDRLVTIVEVACRLHICERTAWTYRAQGLLPQAIKLGNVLRFKSAEIDAWISYGCPSLQEWESITRRDGLQF